MTTLESLQDEPPPSNRPKWPVRKALRNTHITDKLFGWFCAAMAFVVVGLILWIGIQLYKDSALTRHEFGFKFLTGMNWDTSHSIYGAMPLIIGTLITSLVALCFSVPIAVMAAVFLSEYAPAKLAGALSFFIELIAAVPSIIFGFWGFLVLCPLLQSSVYPWLIKHFGWIPLFAGPSVGTSTLAAGIVLAIMVMPFISSVAYSVLRAVPKDQRFAAYGLGATRWETIRNVVLPEAKSGIAGGIMLGLGRAIGETMAVVMVIGSDFNLHASLLKAGYTMPALLANQFNEAFNVPMQKSALLELALVLFIITMVVNVLARGLLVLSHRNIKATSRGKRYRDIAFKDEGSKLQRVWIVALQLAIGYGLGLGFFQGHTVIAFGERIAFAVLLTLGIARFQTWTASESIHESWRGFLNGMMKSILGLAATVGVFALFCLVAYVAQKGIPGINSHLFTALPSDPTDVHSGIQNAIVGTLVLMLISGIIGIPVGLLGGVYVSEYTKGRLRGFIRFCSEVLSGIPSVVVGLFAYSAFVLPFGFSAWSGGVALAVMMIPTVIRTSEEMMRLIPRELREASYGLGATKLQTILFVVIPAARNGIITGIMLAVARAAGETAPLLFTAFGSPLLSTSPTKPIESLTLIIYQYATSPYDLWVRQAWAASFILLAMIFVISLISRLATRTRYASS